MDTIDLTTTVIDLGPMEAVEAAHRLADRPYVTFLDSVVRGSDLGRYSFVAAEPFGTFSVTGGVPAWNGEPLTQDPIRALKALMARFHQPSLPGLPPFQGGAAGFLAYEFGNILEELPDLPGTRPFPQALLHFYDVVVAFDHAENRSWLISTGWPEADPDRRDRRARRRAEQYLEILGSPLLDRAPRFSAVLDWSSNFTRDRYVEAVRKVIDYILDGDIFQANIAQRFEAAIPPDFDPWSFYLKLRARNPATFAAYLHYGDLVIASSSPERFIKVEDGQAQTRPIKGTARRSADPMSDWLAGQALLASEKDRAENIMIVDLLRNDLSRICKPFSVQVPVLCGLESYASIHHLVSVVTGELAPDATAVDVIAACFPGGSITGAPKIRAMQIIGEIEKRRRDIYCGSIGYVSFDGNADTNIAIRTATIQGRSAVFQAGGGITAMSDPDAEYEETLTKARRIFEAFGGPGRA